MADLKLKRMLVVLAHPDDESFAVGGTLAKYAHEGVQIVLLCATRGEAGISGISSEEAGKIREQELLEAAKHLKIEVHFLDYQDGELAKADHAKLMEHIGCWIDLFRPQVILTFGPDGVSGHPDHVTMLQGSGWTKSLSRQSVCGMLFAFKRSKSPIPFCLNRATSSCNKYRTDYHHQRSG